MTDFEKSPTVYGIETEYSCMVTLPGNVVHEIVGRCHSVDAKLGLYKQPESKGSDGIESSTYSDALAKLEIQTTIDGMLSNGARFYIDPNGPEYATAETRTAEEAVHRSYDGDSIVLNMFRHMRDTEMVEDFQINRRVVDHNRSSRGIHLNTTTALPANEPSEYFKERLAALNVSKGALFGSGGLLVDGNGNTGYYHSPRLAITDEMSANYTSYAKRPLVRYPFKEDGHLARIETVTSDALNFAWPLRASLVATNAVVQLLEQGSHVHELPTLVDPVASAQTVGRYGYKMPVEMIDKEGNIKTVMPLDIVRMICEIVLDANNEEGQLDAESAQVIPEIIDVADRMTADPFSVANQVESMGRLVAIRKKMQKDRIKLDSERMCRFDYAWDWLGGGIAESLREKNKAGWQGFSSEYSPSRTKKRLSKPPQDTRAKLRGDMIRFSLGDNGSEWHKLDFNDGDDLSYIEPYDSSGM